MRDVCCQRQAKQKTLDKYLVERFGFMSEADRNESSSNDTSFLEVVRGIEKAFAHKIAVNAYANSKECERAVGECLDSIDKAIQAKLPSKKKLENSVEVCKSQQEKSCIGPSTADQTDVREYILYSYSRQWIILLTELNLDALHRDSPRR